MLVSPSRQLESDMTSRKISTDEILSLIDALHESINEYERLGVSPIDYIMMTPELSRVIEAHNAIAPGKLDFDNLTWGNACQFVMYHHEKYQKILESTSSISLSNHKIIH